MMKIEDASSPVQSCATLKIILHSYLTLCCWGVCMFCLFRQNFCFIFLKWTTSILIWWWRWWRWNFTFVYTFDDHIFTISTHFPPKGNLMRTTATAVKKKYRIFWYFFCNWKSFFFNSSRHDRRPTRKKPDEKQELVCALIRCEKIYLFVQWVMKVERGEQFKHLMHLKLTQISLSTFILLSLEVLSSKSKAKKYELAEGWLYRMLNRIFIFIVYSQHCLSTWRLE